MWFMYMLSWLALLIQICFITLSIAAGLYYLAELIEEYTATSARVIKYMIWASTVIYVCLYVFESFPWHLVLIGLLCNAGYYMILNTFPYFQLASPVFLVTLGLIVTNHYFAFTYFANVWHPFSEVLAFFTICCWVIPFTFFVSLSANEYVLPTLSEKQKLMADDGDLVSNYFNRRSQRYGFLSLVKYAQESILPQRMKKSF